MTSLRHDRPTDEQIDKFWSWFRTVADRLCQEPEDRLTLAELDRRVLAFGDISWEIGPGAVARRFLAITPDGSRERRALTTQIVDRAPAIRGWEFHPTKPPKEWDLRFVLEARDGRALQIDAREWRYTLAKFPDGTFDISIEQPNLLDVTNEDRYAAAAIVLDGILGEGQRLDLVEGIEAFARLPENLRKSSNGMSVLREHLAHLRPRGLQEGTKSPVV